MTPFRRALARVLMILATAAALGTVAGIAHSQPRPDALVAAYQAGDQRACHARVIEVRKAWGLL